MPAKPKVFISTPCHDGRVMVQYHKSLLRMLASNKFTITVSHTQGGGIAVARNSAAHVFLNQSDAEYLLTYDGDLIAGPEHLERLISHNVDIVGAMYPHKARGEFKISGSPKPGAGIDPKTGLIEVKSLGTGFLLVKRHVVEKIRDALTKERYYGRNEFQGQVMTNIYGMGVENRDKDGIGEYITEDFMFCLHAQSLGYKVHADACFYLKHVGDFEYPEHPLEMEPA